MVSCQIFDICLEFEREHIVRGKEQPCLSVSLVRKYVQINLHLSVIFSVCSSVRNSGLSFPVHIQASNIQHPASSSHADDRPTLGRFMAQIFANLQVPPRVVIVAVLLLLFQLMIRHHLEEISYSATSTTTTSTAAACHARWLFI